MEDSDYGRLVELMFKVYGSLHSSVFGTGLRVEGLGRLETGALGYLARNGRSCLSETAESLHVSRPQMSGIADCLYAKKLVERKRDEDDRRVVWLSITQAGRASLCDALAATGSRVKELLSPLPPTEILGIKSSLERLAEALGGDRETQLPSGG